MIMSKTLLMKKIKTLSKRELDSIRSDVTEAHSNYEKGLLKRASYKINDSEVGQDLVQTTFLKTLLYLQKGGKIDVMKSFLNHVLRDLIIDEYRKNKMTSLDILLEKGFEPIFDEHDRTINILDGREIIFMIPLLPKKYRSVIQMRYLKNLSLKEISLITGQSQNTVAVQLHRGLAKLKIIYEEMHE